MGLGARPERGEGEQERNRGRGEEREVLILAEIQLCDIIGTSRAGSRAPPLVKIFLRGWGWDRLEAYSSIQVEWCDYKKYLGDYFICNAGQVAILCAKQKPETVGEGVAAEYNDLHAAANLCIKLERELLRRCRDYLTPEDIHLSKDIKNHAKHLIGSEGESSVAAAGMVCIAKEADLIFELLTGCSDWDTTEMIAFGNQIRRSASNLMLYKGSKSAAAVAGAMLGLAIEAKLFHQYLISEGSRVSGYDVSRQIRRCTAALLTKLEEELAQDTADEEKKRKLEKKRKKKLEKKRKRKNKLQKKNQRLQKKMKLNGGNETKLSLTVAKDKDFEAKPPLLSELLKANGE
ncbi:uncharacterized protein [Miscanthus floridulus]|uniref:uncharacterized protein n=1 Tax=Miscanthus floridulus TaxID=154761 RepID=UPI00345ABE4D